MAPAVLFAFLAAEPSGSGSEIAIGQTDLLDFDQGTVLVSASNTRAEGIKPWSSFYLTDGSKKSGWSTAQKRPMPAEFVFELEQDSELELIRIVNSGVEESSFPGVSARAIELWAAPQGGKFERVATLEAPKNGEIEFPVRAAKPMRQVKLVINSNWGNAEYTELMEVDLIGKKVGEAPPFELAGDYYSPQWQGLRLRQVGTSVEGCYDYEEGTFQGDLDGRVARVTWAESIFNGKPRTKGSATFVVGPDRNMRGIYFVDGDLEARGTWDLEKATKKEQTPKCKPPENTMADQLKRTGRMVVYGIRFDAGSATLKKESDRTLNQILDALKRDSTLKLLIEGHTDSTNSDEFNQTLSEKRARAVVDWLIGKGVPARMLKAKGFGRMKPVSNNATAQGRALNRRVELSVQR